MKANARHLKNKHKQTKDDEAVSPVIAVILMVAITVVLAATVYVWVSGFASEDSGPEQASATARGFSSAAASGNDWIRVTLVKGENAPYSEGQVGYTVLTPTGQSHSGSTDEDHTNELLCIAAQTTGTDPETCSALSTAFFTDGDTSDDGTDTEDVRTWDVGGVLYVPCQSSGDHSITITVRGTTILDSSVQCDAVAS